jgi:hypothetical protein
MSVPNSKTELGQYNHISSVEISQILSIYLITIFVGSLLIPKICPLMTLVLISKQL